MRMFPLVTAVSVLMTVGCSPPKAGDEVSASTRPPACKAKDSAADCSIVVDAWMNTDGSCEAAVVKSQSTVGFKKDAKDKSIEWTLTESAQDDGYRFTSKGIDPKTTPADNVANWNKNFKGGGTTHGDSVFKWKNLNSDSLSPAIDYLYMVAVELRRPHLAPLPCKLQDPVIRNQR